MQLASWHDASISNDDTAKQPLQSIIAMSTVTLMTSLLPAAALPGVPFQFYDPIVLLGLLTVGASVFTAVSDYRRSVRHDPL